MTQNGGFGVSIFRHGSSHSTLEAQNSTDWGKADPAELDGCKEGEKLEIHWNATH